VARERLFALLDEAREHKPAICVVGPPGAGKTTLVASWLDARGIKGIWYQVDPGDADLATFFYYLGEAAKPFARKGLRPLPLLTPEYLHDVEGFSRRFFRELFSRLPEGATLVLDNYQEVAPEQLFHQFIANAVDEVPAGMTLVAVSRRDPPDCYARLIANENVAFVDWEALKGAAAGPPVWFSCWRTLAMPNRTTWLLQNLSKRYSAISRHRFLNGCQKTTAISFWRRPTCRGWTRISGKFSPDTKTQHEYWTTCVADACSSIGAEVWLPVINITRCSRNFSENELTTSFRRQDARICEFVPRGALNNLDTSLRRLLYTKRHRSGMSLVVWCSAAPKNWWRRAVFRL
jgi:hypothetical protein